MQESVLLEPCNRFANSIGSFFDTLRPGWCRNPAPSRTGVSHARLMPCEAGASVAPVCGLDAWLAGSGPMAGLALVLHHFRVFLLGGRKTVGGEPYKQIPFSDFAQFQVGDPDGLGQLLDEATHVVVLVRFAQAENQRFPWH